MNPSTDDEEIGVKEIVRQRIIRLRHGALASDGWRHLLDDGDIDNKCQAPFIFLIQKKCRYLSQALTILYNDRKQNKKHLTWNECCKVTIEKMKEIEGCELHDSDIENEDVENHNNITNLWVSERTIMQWFRDFRKNRECFINVPKKYSLIDRIPPIFDYNPHLKDKFISYAKENLTDLNGELMYDYCIDTLIPELVEQDRKELEDEEATSEEILKAYRITNFSIRTLYNWLKALDFKYSSRRKMYYVDGHERPDNVEY